MMMIMIMIDARGVYRVLEDVWFRRAYEFTRYIKTHMQAQTAHAPC